VTTQAERPYLRPVPNPNDPPPTIANLEAEIARLTAKNRRLTTIVSAQRQALDDERQRQTIVNWLTLAGLVLAIAAFVVALAARRLA